VVIPAQIYLFVKSEGVLDRQKHILSAHNDLVEERNIVKDTKSFPYYDWHSGLNIAENKKNGYVKSSTPPHNDGEILTLRISVHKNGKETSSSVVCVKVVRWSVYSDCWTIGGDNSACFDEQVEYVKVDCDE
jgi:hypothetical protein